jgi:outer membrane immunogenic protein
MKKILLATVALGADRRTGDAADLARPVLQAAPPPPVYLYSWTGPLSAASSGGMWVKKRLFADGVGVAGVGGIGFPGVDFGGHDVSSGIGGIQAGCNYQFAGGWVVGIQGDYGWANARQPSPIHSSV